MTSIETAKFLAMESIISTIYLIYRPRSTRSLRKVGRGVH